MKSNYKSPLQGFTLIELSILLVIIGLIVGGVLAGQNLIAAASLRSQILQLKKFSLAINAFQLKYNQLPGDMSYSKAQQFGLPSSNNNWGTNEDGLFNPGNSRPSDILFTAADEFFVFWPQLSAAGLVEGNYNLANTGPLPVMPSMKLSTLGILPISVPKFGGNYFALGATGFNYYFQSVLVPSLTPIQSQLLDQKIDDGLPMSGAVIAVAFTGQSDAYGDYYTQAAITYDDNTFQVNNCSITGGANYAVLNTQIACKILSKM